MQIPDNLITAGISLVDRYFDLKGLSVYSGQSVSSLRYHIRENGLPAYSIPGKNSNAGKMFIKQSEFDSWLKHYQYKPDLQNITGNSKADEVLRRLQKKVSDT